MPAVVGAEHNFSLPRFLAINSVYCHVTPQLKAVTNSTNSIYNKQPATLKAGAGRLKTLLHLRVPYTALEYEK